MDKKKKHRQRRIHTVRRRREYYRQKQREWRAAHLYGVSQQAVTRVFGLLGKVIRRQRPNGRINKLKTVGKRTRN